MESDVVSRWLGQKFQEAFAIVMLGLGLGALAASAFTLGILFMGWIFYTHSQQGRPAQECYCECSP